MLCYRWLNGLHLASGVLFCIFAKVHLFFVQKSAANIDFNKCNDASVPNSQQRYNPNILRGIKVEIALASTVVDFCFKYAYAQSQPNNTHQIPVSSNVLSIQLVTQIFGLFWYVLLPFLYIIFTPSIRNHISTTFNLQNNSVTPASN